MAYTNRIIINNKTSMGYEEIMKYVDRAIYESKKSGRPLHGGVTSFYDKVCVSCNKTKNGHSFIVWDNDECKTS